MLSLFNSDSKIKKVTIFIKFNLILMVNFWTPFKFKCENREIHHL